MEIIIRNKKIISTCFSNTEDAWKIEDSILVLEYLKSKKKIVLGGDILTDTLQYTYDSWYYNIDTNKNLQFNAELGFKVASKYILNYMETNGNSFYVVFVV